MLKQLLLLSIVLALLFTAKSAVAQTPAELESKYGSPVNAYVVRTGLLLMTKYDVSGQVCEMSVIESRTPGANIITRIPLNAEIVPKLIEELIPEGERGKKTRLYGFVQAQGMTGQVFFNYENVSIELVQQFKPSEGWSDNILNIRWNNRVCK
jgi:hypothetical protein